MKHPDVPSDYYQDPKTEDASHNNTRPPELQSQLQPHQVLFDAHVFESAKDDGLFRLLQKLHDDAFCSATHATFLTLHISHLLDMHPER